MSPYIASLFSPITLGATFRLAAPLLLGIAGFSFSNKAGILNLALESYITFAAFFALLGSWLFNSCWMGLLIGILAGIVFSFLYGCFVFIFRANGLITGVGFNLSSWGLTTMLTVAIFHSRSATNVNAESFSAIDLGLFGGYVVAGADLQQSDDPSLRCAHCDCNRARRDVQKPIWTSLCARLGRIRTRRKRRA